MESFCLDGICYYTLCKNTKCIVQYCIYVLLTGEKICSEKEFTNLTDVNANKESIIKSVMETVNSYKNEISYTQNNEPNDILL